MQGDSKRSRWVVSLHACAHAWKVPPGLRKRLTFKPRMTPAGKMAWSSSEVETGSVLEG